MTIREKLIVLRDKAGISQMELAHQLGVSRQAVSRWESGNAVPSMDKLKALAKIYDVSLDWLCNDASGDEESVQVEQMDECDPESNNAPSEVEQPPKHKHKKLVLVAAVVVLICMMFAVYAMSQKAELFPSNSKQMEELETEDINGKPESSFQFDW